MRRSGLICLVRSSRTGLDISKIFFFFQAEDGIRDGTVTGVQTCALPISENTIIAAEGWPTKPASRIDRGDRSEERRVGKECRTRWSADHYKKKMKKLDICLSS